MFSEVYSLPSMMRIVLVDDHRLFLEGLRLILMQELTAVELLTCDSTEEAMALLSPGLGVDLLVTDLLMPGVSGLALLGHLEKINASLPVLVVSAVEDVGVVKSLMDAGAFGYICKKEASEKMVAAVKMVLSGQKYICPSLVQAINEHCQSPSEFLGQPKVSFSQRQQQVLLCMARGMSNKEIASDLHLSIHTIKSHIAMIFKVLAVSNRFGCIKKAGALGLLSHSAVEG